jgi:hypothetical protein
MLTRATVERWRRCGTLAGRRMRPSSSLSARSIGGFIEFFVSRLKEREHLLVDGLHPEHQRHDRAGSSAYVEEIDPFETLAHPPHGRASGRLGELAGDRLAGRGPLLAQPVFGQPIDQQTEHHHERERHEPLGLLDEEGGGQKQRILEKTEAALDAVLLLVGLDELLVRELGGVEDIGGDQEGGLVL